MHKPIVYVNYAKWWLKPTVLGRLIGESEGEISKRHIGRFIPQNPVILDAGANGGQDSVEMARLWPKSTIHAFEPVPAVFAKLKRNTRKYANIRCYEMALGECQTEAEMFFSVGQDASSSLLEPKELLAEYPDIAFEKGSTVKVNTIDRWAEQTGIDHVDLMWLDMQGYEFKALQGAQQVLKKVRAIHTEVDLTEIYKGAGLYNEVRPWLEKRGFRVEREELSCKSFGNVLFVQADGTTK
jgi:FkbM family methyltransferase